MNTNNFSVQAIEIKNKAQELGYDLCGIIRVDAVEEYSVRLEERIQCFPEYRPLYEGMDLVNLAFPQKKHDWAKSIVVCISRYGKYKIPKGLDHSFGKVHLFDYRLQKHSKKHATKILFESYLKESGLTIATDERRGVTAARFAAAKAGLGVIGKNNFLYTKYGSWVWIDTWVINKELEYYETPDIPSCPENCTECMDACPTGALAGPLQMNAGTCVARLLYGFGLQGLAPEPLRNKMGPWLYGCDDCQNSCPRNKGKWEEVEDFPHLNELAEAITLEKILEMDEETIVDILCPKFFYISPDNAWRWKCNVLRVMVNNYDSKYDRYIKKACNDSNDNIREMAAWACRELGL
jgi:epoxyqueuosine reductase